MSLEIWIHRSLYYMHYVLVRHVVTERNADDAYFILILTDIQLDPGFRDFYRYCKSKDIPVVIVSR